MQNITIAAISPFAPPPIGANLVIFTSEERAYIKNEVAEYMLSEVRRYAKAYEVYVVPEMFETTESLGCCIFAPDGELKGSSNNAFVNLNNRGIIRRGSGPKIIKTDIGNIALLVDTDIGYPQIARECQLEGADIIIAQSFIERMDFYPEMVTYKAVATALEAGVPTVWVTSCGTAIISEKGESLTPFSWVLPIVSKIELNKIAIKKDDLRLCKAITSLIAPNKSETGGTVSES